MRLASVILDIPTQSLDSAYSYAVSDSLIELEVGSAVAVPFGGRRAVGYVIALEEIDENDESAFAARGLNPAKIKEIQQVLSRPYFDEEAAACAQFLSESYIAPLSSCIRLFTPPGGVPRMVRKGGYWQIEDPVIGAVDDRWVSLGAAAKDFHPKANAVKQKAILDALAGGELRVVELAMEFGQVSAVLKTLAASGVVNIEHKRRIRGGVQTGDSGHTPSLKPPLTPGQKSALEVVNAAQARRTGDVVLVDGVTGSGKTEVYLQAIEKTLEEGMSAIVLVPEISLTPQTVARFRGRFGETVAVLHSRMSQGERFDQWDLIRSGFARVVVGARSALFAPVKNLGLIIIDEEHEGSYKQDSAPRYVSRDVAHWMVRRRGATLVLGSATPSIEALYRCQKTQDWQRVELPARVNNQEMPQIEVVDMAREFGSGHRSMFSRRLTQALLETVDAGHKAVLLLNQRGFAKFVLCRSCGYSPQCPSCSLSLTYHEKGSMLVCHHCGYKQVLPALCPECSSPYLKKFGAGTQRVEAELKALFDTPLCHPGATTCHSERSTQCAVEESSEAKDPWIVASLSSKAPHNDIAPSCHSERSEESTWLTDKSSSLAQSNKSQRVPKIVRMDADTTTGKGSHQELLEEFGSSQAAILLGTQMIAKGLDFDDVVLVGVISADTMLRLPDFRSAERTFNLIEQVAGRAGRSHLAGQVIVQTYEADAVAVHAAARYDRAAFLKDELPKRRALGYPPYVRLANVLVWGKDEAEVKQAAQSLFADIEKLIFDVVGQGWVCLPAGPCLLSKLRDTYRWHIVIKAPLDQDIAAVLLPLFRKRKASKTVNVAVDIDPDDLF